MFDNQINEVICKYPKLYKKNLINLFILQGEIDIVDNEGKVWDTYQIEIHPSHDFPKRFPILYEVGGKIPKNADWHIYNDTGACCVTVLPNEIIACKKGINLIWYIELYVIPYLANQTYRRLTGNFANGEYSHGIRGILEFYMNLLNAKNEQDLIRIVRIIFNIPKPSRTNLCFCGSKEKFRKCHREAYEKILTIGREQVISDIGKILRYLEK